MSAVDTIHHSAVHGAAGIAEAVRHGWQRFAEWRRTERARAEGFRNLAYMSPRDFQDIGISRSQLEFHLNTSRHF